MAKDQFYAGTLDFCLSCFYRNKKGLNSTKEFSPFLFSPNRYWSFASSKRVLPNHLGAFLKTIQLVGCLDYDNL